MGLRKVWCAAALLACACVVSCAHRDGGDVVSATGDQTADDVDDPLSVVGLDAPIGVSKDEPLSVVGLDAPIGVSKDDLKTMDPVELEEKLYAYASRIDVEPLRTLRERASLSQVDLEKYIVRVIHAVSDENYEGTRDKFEADRLAELPQLQTAQAKLWRAMHLPDEENYGPETYRKKFGILRSDAIAEAYQAAVTSRDVRTLETFMRRSDLGKQDDAFAQLQKIYAPAAERNDPAAIYALAKVHIEHLWADKLDGEAYDVSQFAIWKITPQIGDMLRKAADLGYAPAELALGKALFHGSLSGDWHEGLARMQSAYAHGDQAAAYSLADIYFAAVYMDADEAQYHARISREKYDEIRRQLHVQDNRDDAALLEIMRMYADSDGMLDACKVLTALGFTDSPPRSAAFARKAAAGCWDAYVRKNASADVCDLVSDHLLLNENDEIDVPLTKDDYAQRVPVLQRCEERAVALGSTYDMTEDRLFTPPPSWKLAAMYRMDPASEGYDHTTNSEAESAHPVEEHAWLVYAARRGDIYSMYDLAVHYEKGISVAKNTDRACYWYVQAAHNDGCGNCEMFPVYEGQPVALYCDTCVEVRQIIVERCGQEPMPELEMVHSSGGFSIIPGF